MTNQYLCTAFSNFFTVQDCIELNQLYAILSG